MQHAIVIAMPALNLPSRLTLATLAAAFFAASGLTHSQTLAPTPPMGWNSWDSYGLTVTEDQFRANTKALADQLKPAGYQYAVVDEGWYLANPNAANKPETLDYRLDANGRYQPALNRFASASGDTGFSALASATHAQGLKFGIHIIRGVPKKAVSANLPVANSSFHAADLADTTDTCPWNPDNFGVKDTPAGQAWYDALFAQYAAWGVDYVKVDCIASHPYKAAEIHMIHRAIEKTGRPIALSLSPGPAPLEQHEELAANAQLWRISNDVWDVWKGDGPPVPDAFPQPVSAQFAVIAAWNPYVKPGAWPDADMLPLGKLEPTPGWGSPRATRLTYDEQESLITLWAISRSPLFFGGNLTELDDFTRTLLTNPDLIVVDQTAVASHQLQRTGNLVLWEADLPSNGHAFALFNLGDTPAVTSPFTSIGGAAANFHVRNVWAAKEIGSVGDVKPLPIPPHGCVFFILKP
jgi:hypothetical protein